MTLSAEELQKGVTCLSCGQRAKLYNRRLKKEWLQALVRLYQMDKVQPGCFFHVADILKEAMGKHGDFALCRHWDLIRADPNQNGYWQITSSGRAFVNGDLALPRGALIFNNQFYGYKGEAVRLGDVLQ